MACRMNVFSLAAALAVAGMMAPIPSQAAGCVSGGAVGGIVGQMVGHGAVGAGAGCAIGHHEANKAERERYEQRNARNQYVQRRSYDDRMRGQTGRQTTVDPNP